MANEQTNSNLIPWYYRRWVWGIVIVLALLLSALWINNLPDKNLIYFFHYIAGGFGLCVLMFTTLFRYTSGLSILNSSIYLLLFYLMQITLLYFGFKQKKVKIIPVFIVLIIIVLGVIGITVSSISS